MCSDILKSWHLWLKIDQQSWTKFNFMSEFIGRWFYSFIDYDTVIVLNKCFYISILLFTSLSSLCQLCIIACHLYEPLVSEIELTCMFLSNIDIYIYIYYLLQMSISHCSFESNFLFCDLLHRLFINNNLPNLWY